uniref:Uncharacterized protein n=1 Tax=Enterobacter hormaechei TaxID=158836 RepID=D3GMR2_9ENTR|nr:hypothetical protein [Enterobacter hormaechei]
MHSAGLSHFVLYRYKHLNIPVAVSIAIVQIAFEAGFCRDLEFVVFQQGVEELIPRSGEIMIFDARGGNSILSGSNFGHHHPFAVFRDSEIVRYRYGGNAAELFCRHVIRIVIINGHPLLRLNMTPVYPHDQLFKSLLDRLFPRPHEMKASDHTFLLLPDAVVHAASVYYCIYIHCKAESRLTANQECLLCEQTRNTASLPKKVRVYDADNRQYGRKGRPFQRFPA